MDINDYAIFVIGNIKKAKLGNILNITDKVIENYNAKDFIVALYKVLLEMNNCNKKVVDSINQAFNSLEKNGNLNTSMILDKMIISIWEAYNE